MSSNAVNQLAQLVRSFADALEGNAPAQAPAPAPAQAQAPAQRAATPARAAGASTRVQLDLVVNEDARTALRNFEDYARENGGQTPENLVEYLQSGAVDVTPVAWRSLDYAGYGSTSR